MAWFDRRAFDRWCDTVVEQIRFRPDRHTVREELAAHYEDHVRDLLRIGYEEPLARERSLAAMGDAESIGKALDKAHKPWLGWLWLGSRWMVAALLALLIFGALSYELPLLHTLEPAQREGDYEPDGPLHFSAESKEEKMNFHREKIGMGTAVIERGGNTISVPYAAAWCNTYEYDGETYEDIWVSLVVAVDDRNPFDETSYYPFVNELVLTFDDGTYYDSHYYDEVIGTDENGNAVWGPADGNLSGSTLGTDPFRSVYHLWISPRAQRGEWMELSYPYGDPWSIRIQWEEAGGS